MLLSGLKEVLTTTPSQQNVGLEQRLKNAITVIATVTLQGTVEVLSEEETQGQEVQGIEDETREVRRDAAADQTQSAETPNEETRHLRNTVKI